MYVIKRPENINGFQFYVTSVYAGSAKWTLNKKNAKRFQTIIGAETMAQICGLEKYEIEKL